MKARNPSTKKVHVLTAVAFVVFLAASLGVRLAGMPERPTAGGRPSPDARVGGAFVPEPRWFELEDLRIPHWSHQNSRDWSLQFRTDLDLLAPLGTGGRNAAEWFVDFRKPDGPRYDEAQAMMARREDRGGRGRYGR